MGNMHIEKFSTGGMGSRLESLPWHGGEGLANQLWLESDDGEKSIVMTDYGMGPEGMSVDFELFAPGEDGLPDLVFVLEEAVGYDDGITRYEIQIAPFSDDYYWAEGDKFGYGIHYDSEGVMSPNRRVKGLPKRIDVEATVRAFEDQMVRGDFSKPVLVRPR